MSGGDKADLVGVPPRAFAREQDRLVAAPVAQIGRIRDPDVRAGVGDRPMDEREVAVDAARQERRVFVVGLHDEAVALERAKVVGERERDARPALAERGVGDRVFAELVDERDARIFDAPKLFGIVLGIGRSVGCSSIDPAVDAVLRARRAQMRVAAAIFDAAEEQRRAVARGASRRG